MDRLQVWLLAAMGIVALACLGGCDRPQSYSQDTPNEVISSAVQMIREGQTQRLPDLIAADNDEMRRMLDRLGVLFGNMQKLAVAAQERFPEDMAKIKAEAEKAAASGEANPLLEALRSGRQPGGGRGGPDDENMARDLINRLFADPYGWLDRNATRLTAEKITDDQAMVLLDGEPLIPVVGLPMIEKGGKWYISLPTNVPPLSIGWPRTKPQWDIIRALVTIIDKAVIEMTEDIRLGRVGGLDQLASKAQEKMIFPAAMAFLAYQREMEVRTRIDRRAAQLRTRQREWVKSSKAAGREVSPKVIQAIDRVSPPELETVVRKRVSLSIDRLTDPEFEELITDWFRRSGLPIVLSGPVEPEAVDAKIDLWVESKFGDSASGK